MPRRPHGSIVFAIVLAAMAGAVTSLSACQDSRRPADVVPARAHLPADIVASAIEETAPPAKPSPARLRELLDELRRAFEEKGCTVRTMKSSYFVRPEALSALSMLTVENPDLVSTAVDFVLEVGAWHPVMSVVWWKLHEDKSPDHLRRLEPLQQAPKQAATAQGREWFRTYGIEDLYEAWCTYDWKTLHADLSRQERVLELACDESIPLADRVFLARFGAGGPGNAAARPPRCTLKILDLLAADAVRHPMIKACLVDLATTYLEDSTHSQPVEVLIRAVPVLTAVYARESSSVPGVAARIAICHALASRTSDSNELSGDERLRMSEAVAAMLMNEIAWSAERNVLRAPDLSVTTNNLYRRAAAPYLEKAREILLGPSDTPVRKAALGMVAAYSMTWRPLTFPGREDHLAHSRAILVEAYEAERRDFRLRMDIALTLSEVALEDESVLPTLERMIGTGELDAGAARWMMEIIERFRGKKR